MMVAVHLEVGSPDASGNSGSLWRCQTLLMAHPAVDIIRACWERHRASASLIPGLRRHMPADRYSCSDRDLAERGVRNPIRRVSSPAQVLRSAR